MIIMQTKQSHLIIIINFFQGQWWNKMLNNVQHHNKEFLNSSNHQNSGIN